MPELDKHTKIIYFLARYGCFSIGVVYILIGIIAILSFLKISEDAAAEARMIELVKDMPFGDAFLWIMTIGLAGYIIWRLFEAITDPYKMGSDLFGLLERTGVALSGTGYALIGFSAIQIILGNSNGSEQELELFTAGIFNWPGGRWLIGIAGLITAGAGIVQFYFVAKSRYAESLHMDEFSSGWTTVVHILAWTGYCARGILLLVLGYFFMKAALQAEPHEVADTDTAFNFIGAGGSAFGNISFILVALGTIAYGLFMFVYGMYYKFKKGK